MEINEQNLLLKLSQGSSRAFAELFHYYYKDLVLFAGSYVKNITESEDIVQEVFIKLWTGRKDASKISSLKAFLLNLYRIVALMNCAIKMLRINISD